MTNLTEQVSQILPLDDELLLSVRKEVASLDVEWTNVYSEYHTGGWQTLSLLNNTSEPRDTVIKDCNPIETTLLKQLPATRHLLSSLGLQYMWGRLARLEADAFMHEHRDYSELTDARRLRLHIPVMTNPFASIIINKYRIHLAPGFIWKLNPIHRHAASNFGKEPRIHIILDCYVNNTLTNLVKKQKLEPICVYHLPEPTETDIQEALEKAGSLARGGNNLEAEHYLLRLFHEYTLEEGFSYELVSKLYIMLGDLNKSMLWLDTKSKFLHPSKKASA